MNSLNATQQAGAGRRTVKKTLHRGIAMLLVLVLLFSSVPAAAFYSPQENLDEVMLSLLTQEYGDEQTARALMQAGRESGLFDEQWNTVSAEILYNGAVISAEQLRVVLAAEGVDLDQTVSVEGRAISLRDFKTMLAIEDEISRIRETYFSEQALTLEQQAAYEHLERQLTTGGLQLSSGGDLAPLGTGDVGPSGVDHNAFVKVVVDQHGTTSGTTPIKFHFELVDRDGAPHTLSYAVAGTFAAVDGTARAGLHYSSSDAGDRSFTIAANASSSVVYTITPLPITAQNFWELDKIERRWSGDKVFFLQVFLNQGAGAQLVGGDTNPYKDVYTLVEPLYIRADDGTSSSGGDVYLFEQTLARDAAHYGTVKVDGGGLLVRDSESSPMKVFYGNTATEAAAASASNPFDLHTGAASNISGGIIADGGKNYFYPADAALTNSSTNPFRAVGLAAPSGSTNVEGELYVQPEDLHPNTRRDSGGKTPGLSLHSLFDGVHAKFNLEIDIYVFKGSGGLSVPNVSELIVYDTAGNAYKTHQSSTAAAASLSSLASSSDTSSSNYHRYTITTTVGSEFFAKAQELHLPDVTGGSSNKSNLKLLSITLNATDSDMAKGHCAIDTEIRFVPAEEYDATGETGNVLKVIEAFSIAGDTTPLTAAIAEGASSYTYDGNLKIYPGSPIPLVVNSNVLITPTTQLWYRKESMGTEYPLSIAGRSDGIHSNREQVFSYRQDPQAEPHLAWLEYDFLNPKASNISNLQLLYNVTYPKTAVVRNFVVAKGAKLGPNGGTMLEPQVHLKIDSSYPAALYEWLTSEAAANNYNVNSFFASPDGGATIIPLRLDNPTNPTMLVGSYEDMTALAGKTSGTMELYCNYADNPPAPTSSNVSSWHVVPGAIWGYSLTAPVYLTAGEFSIVNGEGFPADNQVLADHSGALLLKNEISSTTATWKNKTTDFEWSSSDTDIATIAMDGDGNGVISLTGEPGSVTFSLKALNGNVAGKSVTVTSPALTVKPLATAFLSIPAGGDSFVARRGQPVQIRWSTNLYTFNEAQSAGAVTTFTIALFKADYTDGSPKKGAAADSFTVTGSASERVTSYTIPASALTEPDLAPGRVSYLVEVSAQELLNNTSLTAKGYIEIRSGEVVVQLGNLADYHVPDNGGPIDIQWRLEGYTPETGDAAFQFEVSKNGTTVASSTDHTATSHSLSLDPVAVGQLQDLYTVSVRARNLSTDAWSTDSFVLHVYSSAALKLQVDGVDAGDSLRLSNVDRIAAMDSQAIVNLKRDISLTRTLGINYEDFNWGMVSDQIAWSSSDSGVASLNYRPSGLYHNIEDSAQLSYLPSSQFLLSGLADSDAPVTVTASHVLTGMADSLKLEVQTLRDKLYLFQFNPQTTTTLTYTDGKGNEKKVTSNSKGELAVYDANGIQGRLYLSSLYQELDYQGSFDASALASSEGDASKYELYPMNTFRLRPVNAVSMTFKDAQGNPFTGQILLRGGIYKDGAYCPAATINRQSGNTVQTITPGEGGRVNIRLDTTEFYVNDPTEPFGPANRIESVFFVEFPNDTYYPQIIRMDGSVSYIQEVLFGSGIVNVEPVPSGGKHKPFMAIQTVDFFDPAIGRFDLRSYTGVTGPSSTYPKAELVSEVLWWGIEKADAASGKYAMVLQDQYGIEPAAQASRVFDYPFCDYIVTRNTLQMDETSLKGWLADDEIRSLSYLYYDQDGALYRREPESFRLGNLLKAPVADSENEDLIEVLDELKSTVDVSADSIETGNSLVQSGVKFLTGKADAKDKNSFGMVITPTESPLQFRAFVMTNLGGMDSDNFTGVYKSSDVQSELNLLPSITDVSDMARGSFGQGPQSLNYDSGFGMDFTLSGYFEAVLEYDIPGKSWDMKVVSGGFNAGIEAAYEWNVNQFVGPVPVTAQLKVGGQVELAFQAAGNYYSEQWVNDYLTMLRIGAYIRAFAGIGFDYSIIALKVGIFGKLTVDVRLAFLNQPYRSATATTGQNIRLLGQVGLEFTAKFLFLSYTATFATPEGALMDLQLGKWQEIQNYWEQYGMGGSEIQSTLLMSAFAAAPDGSLLEQVDSRATIEGRDYLERYARSHAAGGPALLSAFGTQALHPDPIISNTYPYSNPVLSEDGALMAYLWDNNSSDVEKTEAFFALRSGGGYNTKVAAAIEPASLDNQFKGYGDSQLKLDGTGDFAVASWVRQSSSLGKQPGDEATADDEALLMSGTEIMASIYKDGSWSSTALTQNASPDLAPAVATNGDKAIVAWRNVYPADSAQPLVFNGMNTIKYRYYDGTEWRPEQLLFSSYDSAITGLEVAMLDDGTAAVVYTLDLEAADGNHLLADESGVDSGLEMVCTIVKSDATLGDTLRLTNDRYADENPQITTAQLKDKGERFILAWHSLQDADGVAKNDIRLAALDKDGTPERDFVDSIGAVAGGDVTVTSTFRLAKGAKQLNDLAIVWVEPTAQFDSEALYIQSDRLRAVKLAEDASGVSVSAPAELATMPDHTVIDHFDAHLADKSIYAVVLASDYGDGAGTVERSITVETADGPQNQIVTVVDPIADLRAASGGFENTIDLSLINLDYSLVLRGAEIPVQLTVANNGISPVTAVAVELGGKTTEFADLSVLPGRSATLTVWYTVPEAKVVNPDYEITATFADSGGWADTTDQLTGKLYLDLPDVGIANLKTLSELDGKRRVQLALYNHSDAQLAGSDRRVVLELYADSDFQTPIAGLRREISADADLAQIDSGSYTAQFTYDLRAALVAQGEQEVPGAGSNIYARAWVEEQTGGTFAESMEPYPANNTAYAQFESLIARNGAPFTLTVDQRSEGGNTAADIRVFNNSLTAPVAGELIATLLDENGRVLESKRSYTGTALTTIAGENGITETVVFGQAGARVLASFAAAETGSDDNALLQSLWLEGVVFDFDPGKTAFTATADGISSTVVTLQAQDPRATVTVNGTACENGALQLALSKGDSVIKILVTAFDGQTTAEYTVTLHNGTASRPGGNTGAPTGGGTAAQPLLTANGLSISYQLTGGIVTATVEDSRLREAAAKSADKLVTLDTRDIDGATGADIAWSPLVLSQLSAGLMLTLPGGAFVRLSPATVAEIAELAGGKPVTLSLRKGSLSFDLLQSGKSLGWSSQSNPALLAMPHTPAAGGETLAVMAETGPAGSILPRSWYAQGLVYAKISRTGRYDARTAEGRDFADTRGLWMEQAVAYMAAREVIQGTSDTTFSPQDSVTRAQFVTLLMRMLSLDGQSSDNSFADRGSIPAWAIGAVSTAAAQGIVQGDPDGLFRPDDRISRQDMFVMTHRALRQLGWLEEGADDGGAAFTDAAQVADYAQDAVEALASLGLIKGSAGMLHPRNSSTRAEAAQFLYNILLLDAQ